MRTSTSFPADIHDIRTLTATGPINVSGTASASPTADPDPRQRPSRSGSAAS